MRIEIKKLDIRLSGGIKGKSGGEFEFNLEDYSSELSEKEFSEYMNMVKSLIEKLLKESPYIK